MNEHSKNVQHGRLTGGLERNNLWLHKVDVCAVWPPHFPIGPQRDAIRVDFAQVCWWEVCLQNTIRALNCAWPGWGGAIRVGTALPWVPKCQARLIKKAASSSLKAALPRLQWITRMQRTDMHFPALRLSVASHWVAKVYPRCVVFGHPKTRPQFIRHLSIKSLWWFPERPENEASGFPLAVADVGSHCP
jgi:hypothetical protein